MPTGDSRFEHMKNLFCLDIHSRFEMNKNYLQKIIK